MSWDEIEGHRQENPVGKRAAASRPAPDELTALVFASGSGARWLERAHKTIADRRVGANVPDAVLRFHEGQRQLILSIEAEVREWLAAEQAKKKAD